MQGEPFGGVMNDRTPEELEQEIADLRRDLEKLFDVIRQLGGEVEKAGEERDPRKLREHLRTAGGRLAKLMKRGRDK